MRQFVLLIQNNRGVTFIEAIVGFALVGVVSLIFVGGMVYLRNTTKDTVLMSTADKQIIDIAENIKSGVENYQINFNYDAPVEDLLEIKKLPMAWGNGMTSLKEDCDGCPGTYGYLIQPFESYRGLYKVTLRMTHVSWTAKGEPYRDYIFVVSAR